MGLRRFWTRRARRLLPALYLVLAVVAFAAAVFYRGDAAGLRAQLLAALTYSTNWFQIVVRKSYFSTVGRPSPLLHLWSLAIEEQFYLVWPLVLLGLLQVFAPSRSDRPGPDRNRRAWIAVVVGCGAVASAVLMASLFRPAMDPSRVYYGTDTRAQGLLFGAVLALLWQPASRRGGAGDRWSSIENRIGLIGLAGLFLVFVRLRDSDRFVFRGGLTLVSLLSVMVIVAAVDPSTWLARRGLGNTTLAAIGKRAYGLYLWSWPIYVFTRPGIDLPLGTYQTLALRLALTAVTTEVSYRYVETPIRNGAIGRWLGALRSPDPARRAHRRRGVRTVLVGAALFVVPVGLSLAIASRPMGTTERAVLLGGKADPGRPVVAPTTLVSPPTTTVSPLAPSVPSAALENRKVTVLADSVLLSAKQAIISNLDAAGWDVEYRGRPALMVKQMDAELVAKSVPVGSTVIVGLGYNSLWEHDRANFTRWSNLFDSGAEKLLDTLTRLGAERVIWVTLREPSKEVIPPEGMDQYKRYVWYFPYVNERLHALRDRHPNVGLADWAAVSNNQGLTYDAIHVNSAGTPVMIAAIRSVLDP
ncbi:MAG: acyltransferase family protein [Acidimicrobiales bacterium]